MWLLQTYYLKKRVKKLLPKSFLFKYYRKFKKRSCEENATMKRENGLASFNHCPDNHQLLNTLEAKLYALCIVMRHGEDSERSCPHMRREGEVSKSRECSKLPDKTQHQNLFTKSNTFVCYQTQWIKQSPGKWFIILLRILSKQHQGQDARVSDLLKHCCGHSSHSLYCVSYQQSWCLASVTQKLKAAALHIWIKEMLYRYLNDSSG